MIIELVDRADDALRLPKAETQSPMPLALHSKDECEVILLIIPR